MKNMLLIVVIYNTKISNLKFIKNNNMERDDIIDIYIYDNSPNKQSLPKIEGVNIHYFHDKTNGGVSVGYNSGIVEAQKLNKDYVLLLDQDSNILFSNLKAYIDLYNIYGKNYLYAPIMYKKEKIYSPGFLNYFSGKAQDIHDFRYKEIYNLSDKSLINSGLMIPLRLIDKIGSFNERIKLDFSDFYFVEKYKKYKSEIILLDLYIEHSLSGDEGKNYLKEMLRYKYYCNGIRELNISFGKLRLFPAFRRMLVLMLKYKSIQPIGIFYNYFIGRKVI